MSSHSLHALLDDRRAERDALLRRITELLQGDERVAAAWLFGSLGRGEGDASVATWTYGSWSRTSTLMKSLRAGATMSPAPGTRRCWSRRRRTLRRAAATSWRSIPAQPDLTRWTGTGRHGRLRASRSSAALIDRAGFHTPTPARPSARPSHRPERDPWIRRPRCSAPFWAMLLIAAKYVARSPNDEQMGLLGFLIGPLERSGASPATTRSPRRARPHRAAMAVAKTAAGGR